MTGKSAVLFFNGPIITMENGPAPEAVPAENGRIRDVGSFAKLSAAAPNASKKDLKGRTLLPSFLDPHSHFFQLALSLLQVSLAEIHSPEEMIRVIQGWIQKEKPKPGQWIIVRDFDQNRMPGGLRPTLAQLDQASSDYPMIIQHQSGHMGFFNSAALSLLQVTPQTPVPEGGTIEKKEGMLTGYMEENAFFQYQKKVPMPGPEEISDAFCRAQKIYASHGITTIQEGMLVEEMLPFYQILLDKNLLYLDLDAYAGTSSYPAVKAALPSHIRHYENHLKIAGMKIFLDGSPQGRTAWMRKPYEGTDFCGYPTMTDEAVLNAFLQAAEEKTQLLAHVNGDAAAAQYLRCLSQAEKKAPVLAELRPVIIHGQLMGKDQLIQAARLHTVISFFVAHVYHWGDTHIRNFGMERASRISPAASALQLGIPVTFHQDSPVIPPDMLETIWCAAVRRTRAGITLGKDEAISPEEALKSVTIRAAFQYGEEREKGSITPGKYADLIILDQNPLTVSPQDIPSIQVLETYKEGLCIWSA